jgi:tetratricopeptide (TPR) repeat protein
MSSSPDRRRFRGQRDPLEEKLWAYRKAAAVMASFDPLTLRPFEAEGRPGEALSLLFDDSVIAYSRRHERRWMLKTTVRVEALRRLGNRKKFVAALDLNDEKRDDDLLQTIFSAYMRGTALPLEEQSVEQLGATLQAVLWLRSALYVPDLDLVRQRLEEKRMIEPFTFLVGDSFAGRTKELEELRTYVGILPPERLTNAVSASIRRFIGLKQRAPLMIHGPGGSGKSTLVAKFLLEHLQAPPQYRFPCAYLDFDDPYLRLDEIDTWIAEAVRQLRIQHRSVLPEPQWEEEPEPFRQVGELLNEMLNRKATSRATRHEESQLIAVFAQAARCVAADLGPEPDRDPPLLLVFDSFEEAQYASPRGVDKLWNLIGELQMEYDTLRVVVSGRALVDIAPINKRTVQTLELEDLDLHAALAFLRKQGVTDPALAAALVKQVHGNPLSLKLAAEVVKAEGSTEKGVAGLHTSTWLIFGASEAVVQGQLYTRILAHIRDEDVRKLAHPGLVLRRITPELILKVLQKPCGIVVRDQADAQRLFEELRRVVSLVTVAEDSSLHHRSDLRRVMLKLLERDKPEQVEEIDRAAIEYYSAFGDPVSRAEEIYHRLRLGESAAEIDERWIDGVQELLGNALDDLRENQRQYLVVRLGGGLLDSGDFSAELSERQVARELEQILADDPGRVLTRLRGIAQRSRGSVLDPIEVRALAAVGELEGALEVAWRAIPNAEEFGMRESLLTLLVTAADVSERLERWEDAVEFFRRAERVADAQNDPLQELDFAAQRFRLLNEHIPESTDIDAIANDIANRYFSLSDDKLLANDTVVRHVASALGPVRPDVLARSLRLVSIPRLEPDQRESLINALESRERTPEQKWLADLFCRTLNLQPPPKWRNIVDAAYKTNRLGDFMQRVLAAERGAENIVGVTLAALIDAPPESNQMHDS